MRIVAAAAASQRRAPAAVWPFTTPADVRQAGNDAMDDRCLQLLAAPPAADPERALQFWVRFSGVTKTTPHERIVRAVVEELVDQVEQAHAAVAGAEVPSTAVREEALAVLSRSRAAANLDDDGPPNAYFPRAELAALSDIARAQGSVALEHTLTESVARHRAFEERLQWLLHGTPPEVLRTLDPREDADRIYHHLASEFRVEGRILELLAINRIAVSTEIAVLIRATRESERRGVQRFYDTYTLFANYFEWGRRSKRGRAAAERINQIHGRYYIPNEGMKYVLLQTAFTWIDGVERFGHRRLLPVEREGSFHALLALGRDMSIEDLDPDYDTSYAWYREFNRRHAEFHPSKRACFDAIVTRSISEDTPRELLPGLLLAARVGMDDDYRHALGLPQPSTEETRAVRSIFFTLGQLPRLLSPGPYLRSLQNNPARRHDPRPETLGPQARSTFLPAIDATRVDGGFPDGLRPITELSRVPAVDLPRVTWQEVQRHCHAHDLWVVLHGEVYDLTQWAADHPGGLDVLLRHAGGDASAAFDAAGHSNATRVFALNFRIARVE